MQTLRRQAERLEAREAGIVQADAVAWLGAPATRACDIVFMDPPFGAGLARQCCDLLVMNGHLRQNALLYVESEPELTIDHPRIRQERVNTAGQVQYQLLRYRGQARAT